MLKQRLDYIVILDQAEPADIDTPSTTASGLYQSTSTTAEAADDQLEKPLVPKSSGMDIGLRVDVLSAKAAPHFTEINPANGLYRLPFTQVSDHYGVTCDIVYSE